MGQIAHRDLVDALNGLMKVEPRRGLIRTLSNVVILNSLLVMTLWVDEPAAFVGLAFLTALFYCYVMITTHDAIHHTLTGWYYFDEIVPRCFGYFIFWPHGLYSELHKLHHKLNGRDLADPERPTHTLAEYREAGPVGRFLIRHQWFLSLFVFGGVGMMLRHVKHGLRFWKESRAVRVAMITDAIGIAVSAMVVFPIVIHFRIGLRFALYILFLERIIGCLMQLRALVEHYGLSGEGASLVETRMINCRNVMTNGFASRFYNRLNFHSVHHAFPRVPYYHLQEAHERLAKLCAASGVMLPEGHGYARTCFHLATHPVLIEGHAAVDVSQVQAA